MDDETALLQLSHGAKKSKADADAVSKPASTQGKAAAKAAPSAPHDIFHKFDYSYIRELETKLPTARLGEAYGANYCEAKVDNFCGRSDSNCRTLGKNGDGKFALRYWIDDSFWGGDGYPIIIETSGEWTADAPVSYVHQFDLAQQHKALMVNLEHRYYGDSQPFDLWSTENLTFLSLEQAAQDVANFVKWLKGLPKSSTLMRAVPAVNDTGLDTNGDGELDSDELRAGLKTGVTHRGFTAVDGCTPAPLRYNPRESRVILVGCSYGGTLASQVRRLHPDAVDGALSSSGPELPTSNAGPMYAESMMMLLGKRIIGGSDACLSQVRTALDAVVQLGTTEGWDTSNLKGWRPFVVKEGNQMFVSAMTTELVSNYIQSFVWTLFGTIPLDQYYSLSWARDPANSTPVYTFCRGMEAAANPLKQLTEYLQITDDMGFEVTPLTTTQNLELQFGTVATVIDARVDDRSTYRTWGWQVCGGNGWTQLQLVALVGGDPQNPLNAFIDAGLLVKEDYATYVTSMLQRVCQFSYGAVVPEGSPINPAWGTWANAADFQWPGLKDEEFQALHGGRNQRKSSRVAYVNNDLDPWRTYGLLSPGSPWHEACVSDDGVLASGKEATCHVSATQHLGPESETLLVTGGSHCADFYNVAGTGIVTSFDMASLRAVQDRKSQLLGMWAKTDAPHPWSRRRRCRL